MFFFKQAKDNVLKRSTSTAIYKYHVLLLMVMVESLSIWFLLIFSAVASKPCSCACIILDLVVYFMVLCKFLYLIIWGSHMYRLSSGHLYHGRGDVFVLFGWVIYIPCYVFLCTFKHFLCSVYIYIYIQHPHIYPVADPKKKSIVVQIIHWHHWSYKSLRKKPETKGPKITHPSRILQYALDRYTIRY